VRLRDAWRTRDKNGSLRREQGENIRGSRQADFYALKWVRTKGMRSKAYTKKPVNRVSCEGRDGWLTSGGGRISEKEECAYPPSYKLGKKKVRNRGIRAMRNMSAVVL